MAKVKSAEEIAAAEAAEAAEKAAAELAAAELAKAELAEADAAAEEAARLADLARASIETESPKAGFTFLCAPQGVTAAGFGETSYEVDKDGCVEVPVDAVAGLLEHGFYSLDEK